MGAAPPVELPGRGARKRRDAAAAGLLLDRRNPIRNCSAAPGFSRLRPARRCRL